MRGRRGGLSVLIGASDISLKVRIRGAVREDSCGLEEGYDPEGS